MGGDFARRVEKSGACMQSDCGSASTIGLRTREGMIIVSEKTAEMIVRMVQDGVALEREEIRRV
ncbi:hypothetical protein KSX_88270 [Ktedonospora formicarum]|uniref:Uncharacterized protein n=1 Tax=Ktedonospora formicarum TaxID=2778364 RepID=A0A8J3IGD2_9CHLR|nr:hypothetical protein KSX_88270 [Ktedonospora formicarum]